MSKKCPYEKKCGGCQYIDLPYEEQLKKKQKETNKLLSSFGKVKPIIGMKDPWHYRNKVHGVVAGDRHGNCFTGIYENRSHRVIRVDSCLIENQKADAIMNTVTSLMKSFKMRPYRIWLFTSYFSSNRLSHRTDYGCFSYCISGIPIKE